jgi:hypothetical protein
MAWSNTIGRLLAVMTLPKIAPRKQNAEDPSQKLKALSGVRRGNTRGVCGIVRLLVAYTSEHTRAAIKTLDAPQRHPNE